MKVRGIRVLLAALIVMTPLMSMAQNRGDRGDYQKRIQEQRTKLKKDLKLDKKQVEKFDKVYETYDKKRTELMQNSAGGDRTGMREKMTKMRDGLNADLKKVLSTKQYKKYQEIEKKRMEERSRGRGDGGGRGGRGGRA